MAEVVGLLHPGQMGASVGAALRAAGCEVLWCGDGRSAASRQRAEHAGLSEVSSLGELLSRASLVVSVCPPDAALELAERVAGHGFAGRYLDANAVSPATARAIAEALGPAATIDGGIVGPPVRPGGSTLLCLSGRGAEDVAALLSGSALATHVVGPEVGQASAVKMAFAAWTKGSSALLLSVRALAEAEGVADGLLHAWEGRAPDLPARVAGTAAGTAPKAWRFAGEMREIASTFEAAGLPGGFHRAAAEVYERMAGFKDPPEPPSLEAVLAALLRQR